MGMGLQVISAIGQLHAGRKQSQQEDKIRRIQQRMSDSQAALERRRIVREARIRKAEIENQAAQTGTLTSSSALSAMGSIRSQAGFNLAQSYQGQRYSGVASYASKESSLWGTRGQLFSTIGRMGSMYGGGQ